MGAFFQSFFSSTSGLLEDNWISLAHIQPSLYSTLRLAGCGGVDCLALQAIMGALAALAVWWVWKNTNRTALRGSALVLGVFLFNPYFLQYDLVVLGLPLVLLVYDCMEHGCHLAEAVLLLLLWLMPLMDWNIVIEYGFHVCPILIALLLLMVAYRVKKEKRTMSVEPPPILTQ